MFTKDSASINKSIPLVNQCKKITRAMLRCRSLGGSQRRIIRRTSSGRLKSKDDSRASLVAELNEKRGKPTLGQSGFYYKLLH